MPEKTDSKRRLTIYALALLGMAGIGASGLDVFLRSCNEIPDDSRQPGQIKTKIGDYVSLRPIGTLPATLLWSLKKWPDPASCVADPIRNILRWERLGGVTEIEVCLTRALAGIVSTEEATQMLAANGFTGPSSRSGQGPSGDITVISATCRSESIPCGPSISTFWFLILKPYAFSVSISRRGEQLLDVKVIPLSL